MKLIERQHYAPASALIIHRKRALERGKAVPSGKVSCVFIVDGEPAIASTLAAKVRKHGYSATFFTSPVEALAAAHSRAP